MLASSSSRASPLTTTNVCGRCTRAPTAAATLLWWARCSSTSTSSTCSCSCCACLATGVERRQTLLRQRLDEPRRGPPRGHPPVICDAGFLGHLTQLNIQLVQRLDVL